jgi:hypothetical protein
MGVMVVRHLLSTVNYKARLVFWGLWSAHIHG